MSKVFKHDRVNPKEEPYSLPVKSREELLKAAKKISNNQSKEVESSGEAEAEEYTEESETVKKARKEAEKIINEAKEEAEKQRADILQATQAEEEKIKEDAYNAGYNEGYEKGYQTGKDQGLKEIKDQEENLLKEAEQELDKAIKKRNNILSSLEREVCELVFLVAEKILEKKIDEEEELINSIVKNGLSSLQGQNKVIIKVHPYDYPKLEEYLESLKHEYKELFLELKEDTNISQGSPLLSIDSGYVELDVSKQARELHHFVKQVIQSG